MASKPKPSLENIENTIRTHLQPVRDAEAIQALMTAVDEYRKATLQYQPVQVPSEILEKLADIEIEEVFDPEPDEISKVWSWDHDGWTGISVTIGCPCKGVSLDFTCTYMT